MTRREDLQQFFISADSFQGDPGFDLDKFTDAYLKRHPVKENEISQILERLDSMVLIRSRQEGLLNCSKQG